MPVLKRANKMSSKAKTDRKNPKNVKTSIQKPPNPPKCPETQSGLSQEAEDQFEVELCWCVQQLEINLSCFKLSKKHAYDLDKSIKILKSSRASLIKKRQIMTNTLGNYREKMMQDAEKYSKTVSSVKFLAPSDFNKKSTFLRKANCQPTVPFNKDGKKLDVQHLINSNSNLLCATNKDKSFKFNFETKETSDKIL